MSETLRESLHKVLEIEENIINNGGEYDEATEDIVKSLVISIESKVDSIHHVLKNLESQEHLYRNEASDFERRARALKNARERLKTYVKDAMVNSGASKLHGHNYSFSMVSTKPSLEIDKSNLPREYLLQVIDYIPDKERIEKDLTLGKNIPGVKKETRYALRSFVSANILEEKK